MSRNKKQFKNALLSKGYTLISAHWKPIGSSVEMIGREGGWVVEYTDDGELNDIIIAYNADDVLGQIDELEEVKRID